MDRKGKKNRPKWTESDKNGKKKKTQKGQKKEEKWTNGTQGDRNGQKGQKQTKESPKALLMGKFGLMGKFWIFGGNYWTKVLALPCINVFFNFYLFDSQKFDVCPFTIV